MQTEADKEANRSLFGSDDEDDESDENAEDVFHDTLEQEDDQDQASGHDAGGEADLAPAEPVPEEEGHVNAEGLIYQQPRAPFAGTIWCGKENAFECGKSLTSGWHTTKWICLVDAHQWMASCLSH